MKFSRFAALAAFSIAACESPTRPVEIPDDLAPLAVKPGTSPSITVTALPSLGGNSSARAINDDGTIIGWSADGAGVGNAVRWTLVSATWTIATLPGGNGAAARAINAAGDIVGRKDNQAVVWPAAGGGPTALGCATDPGSDDATAINATGVVAGFRYDGTATAAVWKSFSACRVDLSPLVEGKPTQASAIDGAGNVYGYARDADNNQRAVRWVFNSTSWNAPEELASGLHAAAEASNSAGDIAGSACLGTPPEGCQAHAVLWAAPDFIRQDLGTLGGQVSAAYALNSAKEVVGWSWTAPKPGTNGFIWSAETGMRALKPPKGDSRSEAYGINNAQDDGSRQVVGFSSDRSGAQRAVVWRVP